MSSKSLYNIKKNLYQKQLRNAVPTEKIPFPNEAENNIQTEKLTDDTSESRAKPIFNVFSKNFFIDDIILLGLIVLLLMEGLEDIVLLIVLIYLLIDFSPQLHSKKY